MMPLRGVRSSCDTAVKMRALVLAASCGDVIKYYYNYMINKICKRWGLRAPVLAAACGDFI